MPVYDPVLLRQVSDLRLAHLRLKSEVAWLRFLLAFERCARLALKAGFNPDQPRDDHGRWTDTGSFDDTLRGLLDEFEDGSLLQDIAYPGDFHDVVRDYFVEGLRKAGHAIETEIGLVLPSVPPVAARIDILARDPNGLLYGLEIKTGYDPTFTPGQRVVYPHAIGGAGVTSYDPRIRSLGLTPGMPLPAFAIRVAYTRGPGERIEIIPLPAEPL